MVKEYDNGSDVRMRLNNTIVFYEGKPYYCKTYEEGSPNWMMLILSSLEDKPKTIEIKHTDPKLDTSAPRLGYINWANSAYFLSRAPARLQSQGLRSDTIWTKPRLVSSNYFTSSAMGNALLGKYPKVSEAEKMLNTLSFSKVAIHRDFAIGWKDNLRIGLFYQEEELGERSEEHGLYYINKTPCSSFMTKLLDKAGLIRNGQAVS